MPLFLDSFWRAAAYCLHPRVILLSLLPLVIMLAVSAALGYFFWGAAVASIATWLDASSIWAVVSGWLVQLGGGNVRGIMAPLLLVLAVTPLVVVGALLLVALLMTPAVLRLVAEVIQAATAAGKEVCVCGEMAGDTAMTRLLLGLGLRSFSMQPAQILAIKQEVLRADTRRLAGWAQQVIASEDPAGVLES